MAKVTGFTAQRMLEIEQASVVDAAIEGADELVFYTRGGKRIRAGVIKGGTAEWIEEYKPIVDNSAEKVGELLQNYNDMSELFGTVDQNLANLDQDLEDMHTRVEDYSQKAVDALTKANSAAQTVTMEYALGENHVIAPTTGWTTAQPVPQNKEIVWSRQVTAYGSGLVERSQPAPMTGYKGESPVMVYIMSTNGSIFKPGVLDTNLVVTVWYDGHKIEDLEGLKEYIGPTAYLEWSWSIPSSGIGGVFLSTDNKITQGGFVLHVTSDDVAVSAVFDCTVNT